MTSPLPLPRPDASNRLALRARWLFPVESEPIENGAIVVENGVITEILTRCDIAHDLGNVAVIPGLVNAHTHLEFSHLAAPLQPALPFPSWLRSVIHQRRSATGDSDAAVSSGWLESAMAGTTLIADIATAAWRSSDASVEMPRVIPFFESLGLIPEQKEPQLKAMRTRFDQRDAEPSIPFRQAGISPHAPYSVRPELFRALIDLAIELEVPVAMHLAETRDELELLERGTGRFVEFLEGLSVWDPTAIPRGTRILDYLEVLAKAPRALVVHGNYLNSFDLDFLRGAPNMSVVYCPRTHAFFGHSVHPWQWLLARGINVALGTDSRASNPDLSVLSEMKFLHARFPQAPATSILQMGTLNGARALGLQHETGSLTPGKIADLTVISLDDDASQHPDVQHDPLAQVLAPASRVLATMGRGTWISPAPHSD